MVEGLVVVDKEGGWTSHDVVAKLRGVYHQRQVGHAGTLDPDATGVLLVGLGRVTRLLRFLTALPKTYTAEIVFGVETSTLDASGAVVATHDMAGLDADAVAAAATAFVGEIDQVPPMVSAIKVGGRRLHELARAGEEVERSARRVTVRRFDVVPTGDALVYRAVVECSSGTYVRSLAADLGAALGGGAHLRDLRRTAIGSFGVDEARRLLAVAADPDAAVLTPRTAVRDLDPVTVDDELAARIRHGARLERAELGVAASDTGPWAMVAGDGGLLAIYEPHRGGAKPAVVVSEPR